nr:hypothetical protein BaRGS_034861 [Batillaria attramentaria]
MSAPSSTSDMQDLVDKLDSKLSSTTNKFYLHNATDATETQDGNTSNSNTEMTTQAADIDATTQVSGRVVERVPASSVAIDSPPPNEFKVPAAAVGVPNAPKSPAQVHVKHDTLTEEKAVIKKSPSQKSPETPRPSARSREPAEEPTQKAWKNLLSEAESFEGAPDTGSGGMVLGKAEQDAMEVDNLCNKLVDELQSAQYRSSPPTSPKQRMSTDTQNKPTGSRQEVSRDRETVMSSPRGTVQVEAVVKRTVEGTGVDGGEAVMEQRLLRVESFGDVEDEELQNAVNTGKEMLLAHAPASSPITTTITTTPTPTPSSEHRAEHRESYHQMTASRSSLDDSALQLAAERHDTFVPNWEGSEAITTERPIPQSKLSTAGICVQQGQRKQSPAEESFACW